MKKTVVVGLSGGVDSSVAAALLIEQGYNVIGLYMRNWDSTTNNDILGNPDIDDDVCPQEVDYQDAEKVAKKLGVPIFRVDFIKEYWITYSLTSLMSIKKDVLQIQIFYVINTSNLMHLQNMHNSLILIISRWDTMLEYNMVNTQKCYVVLMIIRTKHTF